MSSIGMMAALLDAATDPAEVEARARLLADAQALSARRHEMEQVAAEIATLTLGDAGSGGDSQADIDALNERYSALLAGEASS